MVAAVGIRAEDKNRWERRAPLSPDHVRELVQEQGLRIVVETSRLRAFPEADYEEAGAEIAADLSPCGVILGVKEVPTEKLLPGMTYLFFPHVTKGQAANMPMLRRLMELGCTLLDFERVVDAHGRRLIFFGRHAGYAGMIDALRALGMRLAGEGFSTPLEEVRPTHEYAGLDEALRHLTRVGERIRREGLPRGLRPVVIAVAGSGNVSRGALEVCARLPAEEIVPEELSGLAEERERPTNVLHVVSLGRRARLQREDGGFDEEEHRRHPERYRSALAPLLPHITVLVNGTFWEPGLPRLVTADQLRALWARETQPKLRVIADITCDIGGAIEVTVEVSTPGDPVYVWNPKDGTATRGVTGRGPVVLAVDNLPCELPVEATAHFGDALVRFVPPLARCRWDAPLEELELPAELHAAVVVHRGELTPSFTYLRNALEQGGSETYP